VHWIYADIALSAFVIATEAEGLGVYPINAVRNDSPRRHNFSYFPIMFSRLPTSPEMSGKGA